MEEKEFTIDIMQILYLLKRSIALILVITIIFATGGFIGTKLFITPKYAATSKMMVSNKMSTAENQQVNQGNNLNDIQASQVLVKTYGIILKSDKVLNKVIENLNTDESVESLKNKITVTALDQTQVMEIKVIDTNPDKAKQIMTEITKVAPEIIVDSVGAGACNVLDEAKVTSKPVSPNVKKNSILAGLLGLFISLLIVIGKEFINNTVKSEEDISEKLGLPVLGVIPKVGGK